MTLKSLVKISSVVSFSLLSFFSVSPKFIEMAVFKIANDLVVVLVLGPATAFILSLCGLAKGEDLHVQKEF